MFGRTPIGVILPSMSAGLLSTEWLHRFRCAPVLRSIGCSDYFDAHDDYVQSVSVQHRRPSSPEEESRTESRRPGPRRLSLPAIFTGHRSNPMATSSTKSADAKRRNTETDAF